MRFLLLIIGVLATALLVFLTVFIVNFIGQAGVRLKFVDSIAKVEVFSEVEASSLVASSSGEVDYPKIKTDVLGVFELEFTVTNSNGYKKTFTQTIEVVDTTPPIVSLKSRVWVIGEGEEIDYQAVMDGKSEDRYDGLVETHYRGTVDQEAGVYEVEYYATDSSGNESSTVVYFFNRLTPENMKEPFVIDKTIIVNKKIPLPKNYGSGRDPEANRLLANMLDGAKKQNFIIKDEVATRNYQTQQTIFEGALKNSTISVVNKTIAIPGYCEHQTGLAFDLTDGSKNFGESGAFKWLVANCADYGFILRYPKGKEKITGYSFQPEHFRYVGVLKAQDIMSEGLTLEEYFGLEN